MAVCLWYNPGCGTCRTALGLLQQQGIVPQVVRYMDVPPTSQELRALLRKLGIPARELLRTKAREYLELGLENTGLSEDALIAAMCAHPGLIQRPVVIEGDKAIIGRPAERVLELAKSNK